MSDQTFHKPGSFPEQSGKHMARSLNSAARAREFAIFSGPQNDMVASQLEMRDAKRSFWNPRQINEKGSKEIRDDIKNLNTTEKIVFWSAVSITMAEMLGYIARQVQYFMENGMYKGKLDLVDLCLGAAVGATSLIGFIWKQSIDDNRNECYVELLKRRGK